MGIIGFRTWRARTLTEVQFDEWEKSLKEKPVWWEGVVIDVDTKFFSDNLAVRVDMDETGVQDVYFDVPPEIGISLKKKQRISFSGRIRSFSLTFGFLSIFLKDVTVESE